MSRKQAKRTSSEEETHVLNVDLDILSDAPLKPLVSALGERVDVLHVGRWGRRYGARLEVGGSGHRADANRLIRRLVALVKTLPDNTRILWNRARRREFNVGIEAAVRSPRFEWQIDPKVLEAVQSVDGRLVVTIYAPERLPLPIAQEPRARMAVKGSATRRDAAR
jgi:hypothetical protein